MRSGATYTKMRNLHKNLIYMRYITSFTSIKIAFRGTCSGASA